MSSEGQLDHELAKQLATLVEKLTTTGALTLDAQLMKELKKICKMSDMYVERAYRVLMAQLGKEHSEIRLSTFQVISEIFTRSHAFRELLVTDFQHFLELTVETDQHHQPLPPPRAAAIKLKADTLKTVQQWQDKYGSTYRKLALGYRYLKTCRHVNFNDIRARSLAEQRRQEQREQQRQKALAAKLAKVRKEFSELQAEIDSRATEAENCIELLLPKPDFLFTASDFQQADSADTRGDTDHTVTTHQPSASSPHSSRTEGVRPSSSSSLHKTDASESACGLTVSEKEADHCVSAADTHKQSTTTDTQASHSALSITHADSDSATSAQTGDCSRQPVCDTDGQNGIAETTHSDPNIIQPSLNGNQPSAESNGDDDDEDEDDEDDDEDEDIDADEAEEMGMVQTHGLGSRKYNLQIEVEVGEVRVRETEDNRDLVRTLKDSSCLVSLRFLPQVLRWLEALSKAGGSQKEMQAMIDLKRRLEDIKAKCAELRVVPDPSSLPQPSDSEEEMEEVPEKEGFEPVIPPHLRAEYGLDPVPPSSKELAPGSSTNSTNITNSSNSSSSNKTSNSPKGSHPDKRRAPEEAVGPLGLKKKKSSVFWNLNERNQAASVRDPTSRAANIVKLGLKDEARPSTSKDWSLPGTSQGSHTIPTLSHGTDLDFWGAPEKMEAPLVVKNDSLHRFWMPVEVENEKPSQNDIAAVMNRTFHYTGQFVPVKWKCRAKLPNGKLCERMDRVKCPFHGKIIARDEEGRPAAEADIKQETEDLALPVKQEPTEADTPEVPPWLDAALQEEIEAATGHDLGSKRSRAKDNKDKGSKGKGKGKGKGKKSKYEGLTNIKESKNTSRSRLEAKVLSKRALKRVSTALDAADFKRVRDKFGNQFNYAIKK